MKGVSGRMGLQLPTGISPGLKNAAAVMITADLPAFSKPGQRIDITVSAIGKAKSRAARWCCAALWRRRQIYAMAQGNLAVGGLGVAAKTARSFRSMCPPWAALPKVPRWNARSTPASKARRAALEPVHRRFPDRPARARRDQPRYPGMASADDAVTSRCATPTRARWPRSR
jgi:flagellar P-ring protein precursor FlgI